MLMFSVTFILFMSNILFTQWRYREIEKLSRYLRKISSGNFYLDVRDNNEGELSILKSEIYKVTNILSEYANHLERNKQHLTEAISDISHQLKTPLTSMTVMTDLLAQSDLPRQKHEEFTHHIHTQLKRLDWLVTSLLKLSKLDSGTVNFNRESIQMKHILEQVLESLLVPIDVKQLKVKIEGSEHVRLFADFAWTKEALINILKNCIEHSPERGEILLRFSQNALYTEILIADQGSGIAKEDLPYIFKRFYKGKHASDQSVGIGLALAHRIITEQGGDIEVFSEVGRGSEFRIKFYRKK